MALVFVKMDVKLPSCIIFLVCVIYGLQSTSAQTFSKAILTTNDSDRKCTRTYTSCSLDLGGGMIKGRGEKGDTGIPGSPGAPGEVGQKGEPGTQGLKGEPGVKGSKGEAGINGTNGLQGFKGDPGEKGEEGIQGPPGIPGKNGRNGTDGPQGPPGVPGERGKDGLPGMPGLKGAKGERGENGKIGSVGPMGLPGPAGPPGSPGSYGVCPCSLPPSTSGENEDPIGYGDFGLKNHPSVIPCKDAPVGTRSGKYYTGPPLKEMLVYCDMSTLETCIRFDNKTSECGHKSSKGFWLNEIKVHMKELYNSISVDQLKWLRDNSEHVRQTLKYNCLDSVPYNKHNISASVKLWAWNDVVIGPYPTDESPIFYTVPDASDHCKAGSTEWKSTIIELQSSNVYRLPIVDLWIGDIREVKHQKMSIESTELCFG